MYHREFVLHQGLQAIFGDKSSCALHLRHDGRPEVQQIQTIWKVVRCFLSYMLAPSFRKALGFTFTSGCPDEDGIDICYSLSV